MSSSWYIVGGLAVGIICALGSVVTLLAFLVDGGWDRTNKKVTIPLLILGLTAWFWAPWLLYVVSLFPKPPLPPPTSVEKS